VLGLTKIGLYKIHNFRYALDECRDFLALKGTEHLFTLSDRYIKVSPHDLEYLVELVYHFNLLTTHKAVKTFYLILGYCLT